MTSLVIAQHNQRSVHPATLIAINAATQFGAVVVLLAGENCESLASELAGYAGVQQVLLAEHATYRNITAEKMADLLQCLVKNNSYTHVVMAATTFGKNCLPRFAALVDSSQISDVIEIINHHTYKRPMYAGNVIATVECHDALQVLTVRTTAFTAAKAITSKAPITRVDFISQYKQSQFIELAQHDADKPQLEQAEIVIAGGRGLKDAAGFTKLNKIAERMKAAFGASRAAVDAGLAPNDCQVGQTGKVLAPKVYFAVGISGAIQHLAGMKDSKLIIAINKDAEAPIFQIADFGVVADIETVLPQWETKLDEMGL